MNAYHSSRRANSLHEKGRGTHHQPGGNGAACTLRTPKPASSAVTRDIHPFGGIKRVTGELAVDSF